MLFIFKKEFWDRLPSPKYAISMPCCGDALSWSKLSISAALEYEDYEVFSPKRRIYIYYDDNNDNDKK